MTQIPFTPYSNPRRVRRDFASACIGGALLIAAAAAVALPGDADQPIHVEARQAEIDQQKRQFIYTGEVTVNQGTLSVTADRMVVEYEQRDNKQTITRITATGNPAVYSQQLEEDEGRVQANARKIVYHAKDEKIDLEGDARLTQQGNEMTGEIIKYDVVAGRVDASSGDNGRTSMILNPPDSTDDTD